MPALFADRALRRTVILLILTDFFWGIATFFVLPSTTVPAYLGSLGASPAIIGVMAVAMLALPLAMQFISRPVLHRFPHRKNGLVIIHLVAIIPYFIIPFLDQWLAGNRALLITLILSLLAYSQLVLGLVIPTWLDMVAQVIPLPVRGQYFGIASACFSTGGILGGLALMGLQSWLGDGVYRGAFFTSGIFFVVSMTLFFLAPVPESAFDHQPESSVIAGVRKALRACHPSTNFGRLVISYGLQVVAMAIIPFLVRFASDPQGLHWPAGIFSRITLWQAIGGAVGSVFVGWMVDRHGPRWPWVGVTLIIPIVVLLYPAGASLPVLVICSLLVGVLTTHWSVGGPALLELSPPGDKSSYIAISNLVNFLPSVIGPLVFAGLIEGPGYPAAFIGALLVGLAAFAAGLTLRARRAQSAGEPTLDREMDGDETPRE
ncbi:MAG: MFS transporter [Armatimonadota bacterium]